MLRCGCGMMIECEVKSGQTAESIEHTRREGGETVGMQASNERLLKEGGLWNEWEEQRVETVESIENTRIEGGDGVGVKIKKQEDDGMVSKQ